MQVRSEWVRGNHYGAQKASQLAKNWGIAGLVVGSFLTGGYILLAIISTAVRVSAANNY